MACMALSTQGPCLCDCIKSHKGEKAVPHSGTGRAAWRSAPGGARLVLRQPHRLDDDTAGGFTISFRASKASMSPIFAAAHARGGVRASRMAANSCGHGPVFRGSTATSGPGV